ncbi:MAG: protein BatD, partial [Proteobacteria bacterium]|nr:protein BatD [Pseudomonadota bacterium]
VATVKKDPKLANRGFFSNTEKIHVRSNVLQLNVQGRPEGASTGWWLPAQTVSLTADWDTDINTARVDEPITRKLMLSAKAVHSTQLPMIKPPELDSAKIYPDQPQVSSQQLDDAIVSYRTEKWAVIPRKPGSLRLPEIRLSWYDTIRGEYKEEIIPAETINVLPADNSSQEQAVEGEKVTETGSVDSSNQTISVDDKTAVTPKKHTVKLIEQDDEHIWKVIAIVAMTGWVISILVWWSRTSGSRKRNTRPQLKHRSARVADLKLVNRACKSGKPGEINAALLAWSKDQWPDRQVRNLQHIAKILEDKKGRLAMILSKIEAALYSSKKETVQCHGLARDLRDAVKRQGNKLQKMKNHANSLLPHL